jgi:membrane-associated phospholipid phosphatase
LAKENALARPRRRDVPGWGEAIVCLWAWLVMAGCFVGLALHAASGHIARTDLRLLNASHQLPGGIEPLAMWQERFGNPAFLAVCVVVVALLLLARQAWVEGLVVFSGFGVFALTVLVKHVVHEVPPFKVEHAEYVGIFESNFSFPSGHVVGLTVLGGLIFLFADRLTGDKGLALLLRLVAFVYVASAGVGRVWLGVHYPTDVIAAYLLASLFLLPVWFCFSVSRRTMRRQDGT